MSSIAFKVTLKDQESIKVDVWDSPHFYSLVHIHPEYQITYVEEGHGMLYFGENAQMFREGDIYLIGPNVPHVFIDHQESKNKVFHRIRATTIFFPKLYADQIFSVIKEAGSIRSLLGFSLNCIQVGEKYRSIIAKSILQMKNIPVGFERVLCLMYILHNISLDYKSLIIESFTEGKVDLSRIERVFDFTIQNYFRKIELSEIAALINMTETAFCRFFKLSTSKSYVQFLIEVRVSMACKYMVSEKCNLSEIAYKVGFNSTTNFIKQFKKVMHLTPSEYRKQLLRGKMNLCD